jgi:hypothetical protein
LVSHSSTEDDITVYALGNNDEITHIILAIHTEDQYGAAVITGNIPIEEIGNLIHIK